MNYTEASTAQFFRLKTVKHCRFYGIQIFCVRVVRGSDLTTLWKGFILFAGAKERFFRLYSFICLCVFCKIRFELM